MSTTAETDLCWTVRWGPEDDEISHLPTAEAAEKHRDFVGRPVEIVLLDAPCHTITCAVGGCGYRFDEDEGVTHFESAEEAVRWVLLCGWIDSPAGPVCQGCIEDGRYTP